MSAEFDGPGPPPFPDAAPAPEPRKPVILVTSRVPVKLDLACGERLAPGFTGVDLFMPGMIKVDLNKYPWPWPDASVDALRCQHFVEHLPMCYILDNGEFSQVGSPHEDAFFRFFDEAWRIMKPGAQFEVVVPYLQNKRSFQDPTHRRFLSEFNFLYLDATWRQMNGLTHYGVKCNFQVRVDRVYTNPFESLKNPETQAQRAENLWNTVADVNVLLVKPELPPQ